MENVAAPDRRGVDKTGEINIPSAQGMGFSFPL